MVEYQNRKLNPPRDYETKYIYALNSIFQRVTHYCVIEDLNLLDILRV